MQAHNEVEDQAECAVPPALPVKKSPKSRQKRVVAPTEDVVFELENVPLPLATDSAKIENGVDHHTHLPDTSHTPPSLPEKKPQPPARSPPPSPTKRAPPSPTKKVSPPLPVAPAVAPQPLGSELKDVLPPSTVSDQPPPPPQRRATTDLIPPQPRPPPPRKSTLPDIPPPLPEKDDHGPPPSFTPLPPLPERGSHSPSPTLPDVPPPLPEKDDHGPPPSFTPLPPLPERESHPPPPSISPPLPVASPAKEKAPRSQGQETPPLHLSTTSPSQPSTSSLSSLPPLPPKDEEEEGKQSRPLSVTLSSLSASGPPPLPPKEEEKPGVQIELVPSPPTTLPPSSVSAPPPLPPKEAEIPPPPPPLSEKDDSEASDFYSDSEEEELGPLLSITSASLRREMPEDDDVLTLSTGGGESPLDILSEGFSPSPLTPSSVESTPKHMVAQVRQVGQGSAHNNIMMVSPQPPVIVETMSEDYENQETIDQVMEEREDGDYADQNKIGQIHGVKPIRSRTVTPDDRDYVNQETLEEDIIPVGIAMDPNAAPVHIPDHLQIGGMEMQERDTGDYVNLPDDQKPQSPPLVAHGNQTTSKGKEVGVRGRPSSVNENASDPTRLSRPQTPRGVSPERIIMSPTSRDESALDFGGRTSPRMLTPEPGHRQVKQSLSVSSGGSSGGTTPGSISLDGDYYEAKEADELLPLPSSATRHTSSVYRPSGGNEVR